jgi:hypothetical protein
MRKFSVFIVLSLLAGLLLVMCGGDKGNTI